MNYFQLAQHYENLLYWNNVRAAIYLFNGKVITDSKHIFKKEYNPVWKTFTGITQLDNKIRITPLYFNKQFFGFIALHINCDHFDSMCSEMRDNLILKYITEYYDKKF